MNKTLIGLLDSLNNILALVIVVGCTLAGLVLGQLPMGVVGFLVGLVSAAIICGVLAIFIEVEKHLRKLVALRENEARRATAPPTPQ